MPGSMNRRRFIRISGAWAALGAAGFTSAARADDAAVVVWRGITLGTLTRLEIRHPDRERAARIIRAAAREIERLDAIFTLYRPDSALVRLNRDGLLESPPFDLVRALSEARALGDLTDGAFDVSVQPLWQAYATHFFAEGSHPPDSLADSIRRATERVDYRSIQVEPSRVRLAKAGMAVTLNGIAPGYITDRIVELLMEEGLEHLLVDLGEIRAAGLSASQRPWRAGIRDPSDPGRIATDVPIVDGALATSSGSGFCFDASGRFHHIFDPRSGACPRIHASVSVLAPTATTADALATACSLMPQDAIGGVLRAAGATRAIVVDRSGARHLIDA